jgi:hypothetical protein
MEWLELILLIYLDLSCPTCKYFRINISSFRKISCVELNLCKTYFELGCIQKLCITVTIYLLHMKSPDVNKNESECDIYDHGHETGLHLATCVMQCQPKKFLLVLNVL